MAMYNERASDKILDSWQANAANWVATIDNNEIESRNLITNRAIVETILSFSPTSVLDIGCGEGWLTRALKLQGLKVFGVDAVATLVQNAILKDGNHYAVATFKELAEGKKNLPQQFDAAVINFSLLDKEETALLLGAIKNILLPDALVFIQTLHPVVIAGNDNYKSGWREGSWNGLKRDFVKPYKWYFRTLADWVSLFQLSALELVAIKEPLHPQTLQPASIIFVCKTK